MAPCSSIGVAGHDRDVELGDGLLSDLPASHQIAVGDSLPGGAASNASEMGCALFQESQQSTSGGRGQLLGVQGSVVVRVSRFETLLHNRQIFILRQRAIMVRIGGGQFLGS